MGVLYKPFSIAARMLSRRTGRAAFAGVWERLGDGERPPAPNAGHRSLGSVFWMAALEAAILAGIGAMMEQLGARAFHQIFGAWPAKPVDPVDDAPPLNA